MLHKNLRTTEVNRIRLSAGRNILPAEKTPSALKLFLRQFANPLVYTLAGAGLVSFFLQKYVDIVLIFSVVVINALMGFFQENKTQKTLAALKKLVKPVARVLRDDERQDIDAAELVPGDVVFLAAGDRVPADGRLLEAFALFTDEAVLTGESEAINKEQDSEVFLGTVVSSGRGIMRVEKIGQETKIGRIAQTLKDTVEPETTLQIRLKKLTRALILISVFLASLVFVFGFALGRGFGPMLELAAILLVAAIPEALIIVITLVLVLAMRNSLNRQALIRKILAVETLGAVTMICTDKTGTLTEGKMRVVATDFVDQEKSFLSMCLCNDLDDTLEIALWDFLRGRRDFDQERTVDRYRRISEIPFGSGHKFMASVNDFSSDGAGNQLLVKGAPEAIMQRTQLTPAEKKGLMDKINGWAAEGLKLLAFAHQAVTAAEISGLNEKSLPPLV